MYCVTSRSLTKACSMFWVLGVATQAKNNADRVVTPLCCGKKQLQCFQSIYCLYYLWFVALNQHTRYQLCEQSTAGCCSFILQNMHCSYTVCAQFEIREHTCHLSEPHTSVTALRMCVCMFACLLACGHTP